MKSVIALRSSAALLAGVLLVGAAKAETDLVTFYNTGFEYPWGDYTQTLHPTHVNLHMPSNNAGGAGNLADLDLSAFAAEPVSLTARVGALNTAQAISIVLRDTDGTEQKWDLSAASFNSTSFTTVSASALNAPDGSLNAGSTPGLNLSAINGFQIWGDFNSSYVFDFDIQRISAGTVIPEPSSFALLGGGVMLAVVAMRRRRGLR